MLEYGFSGYQLFCPVKEGVDLQMSVPVHMGGRDSVKASSGGICELLLKRNDQANLSLEVALLDSVTAPVYKGDVIGEIRVMRGEEVITTLPLWPVKRWNCRGCWTRFCAFEIISCSAALDKCVKMQ